LGDVIVAVGTRADAQARTVAAVWTSADDGATWERSGDDNPAFSIRRITQMIGVGRGGPGLIAVGISFQDGAVNAHAWSSVDGRTWRRTTDPPEWGGPGNHQLSTACALPDGTAVVMGVDIVKGETDAWAWTSRDGVTWERAVGPSAAPLSGPGNQFVTGCASTPRGVLVSGGIPGASGSEGAVWSSADGHTWSLSGPSDTDAGSGRDRLLAIAADGSRVVATAVVHGDVVVYTSTDAGATWSRRGAASFGSVDFPLASEALIVGKETVAAGTDGNSGAVWIGPAP
jgi:WD40 repeat protein